MDTENLQRFRVLPPTPGPSGTIHTILTVNQATYIGSEPYIVRRSHAPAPEGPTIVSVTTVHILLEPLSKYGSSGNYRNLQRWATSTCSTAPVSEPIMRAAVQLLLETAQVVPKKSRAEVLGPSKELAIAMTYMLPGDGSADGNVRVVDEILGTQGWFEEQPSGGGEAGGEEPMVPAAEDDVEKMVVFEVLKEGGLGGGGGSNSSTSSATCEGVKEDCSICHEKMAVGEEIGTMPCKHAFHAACIRNWLGRSGICPLCRYEMPRPGESSG